MPLILTISNEIEAPKKNKQNKKNKKNNKKQQKN